jgi:1,4-alpha-glucan branching enzyme
MLYFNHGLGTDFTGYEMYFNDGVDEDAFIYLALANALIHEVRPDAVTIAEDVSGMPGCASPIEEGGMGFDYRMAMGIPDYWFKLADGIKDEDWPMGYLYYVLNDHRKEEKIVSYVESHDQALVGGKTFIFTLADDAMYDAMDRASGDLRVDRAIALHKMARLATLGTSGGAYLNFMGNEFGHPEWIDFPREGNKWSYAHARRMWSLRDNGFLFYKCLGDFDEAMMKLLSRSNILDDYAPVRLLDNDGDKVLAFMRGRFIFIFNFNATRSFTDYGVMVPPGEYRRVLDTDETRFGGHSRIKAKQKFFTCPVIRGKEQVDYVKVYLPSRTAIILERIFNASK